MASSLDIIVGGGAAGIGAAARRLAASGMHVTLLEVSWRHADRPFTQDLEEYPLNQGCEWLPAI